MQRPETPSESFQGSRRLIIVKLSCGIREVNAALRIIVIFGTGTNNIGI
jgi:hypothetical protein